VLDKPDDWPVSKQERLILELFRIVGNPDEPEEKRKNARRTLDQHARRVMNNSARGDLPKPTNMFLGDGPSNVRRRTRRGWRDGDRVSRTPDESQRMRVASFKRNRREHVIDSLQRTGFPSVKDYKALAAEDASLRSYGDMYREFGSWPKAIEAARKAATK
jgi:hypothetical protein